MGKKRTRRRYLPWVLLGLFLLTAITGLAFYRPFAARVGLASPHDADSGTAPPPLPGTRTTFLVMGVDERPGDVGRSDSMVVASYDPATQQLAMFSLPRDTWVQIPGYGYDKLNHSYAYGGAELTKKTVERLLGIAIDHYVTLSFQGFAHVVDALGGVEINAEKRMYYVDPYDTSMGAGGLVIDIQPGLQAMDGLTALKYARFRMDEEGDLGRVRRQQQVVKALVKKAAQPSVITRIPQLIPALADTVKTDISVAEALKLATGAKEALSKPLKTGTLGGEPQAIGPVFYQVLDLEKERAAAYEVLVGSEAPEEFLSRAREDQAAYESALADAIASAPQPDPTDEDEAGTGGEGNNPCAEPGTGQSGTGQPPVVEFGNEQATGDCTDGSQPGSGGGTGQPGSGDGSGNGSGSGAGQPGSGSGTGDGGGSGQPGELPGDPNAHPAPFSVAVVDASGVNLVNGYVEMLRSAGFQVVGARTAPQTVSSTVALDHGGSAVQLKALIPSLMVVDAPDSTNPVGIELILGTDLAP